jgi:hypothetical protein
MATPNKFGPISNWRATAGINPEVLDLNDGTMVRGLSPTRTWNNIGLSADSFRPKKAGLLEERKKIDDKWVVQGTLQVWKYEGRWQPGIIFRSKRLELDEDGGIDAYHPPTPNHPHGKGPGMGRDSLICATNDKKIAYNPQNPNAPINGHPWDHANNTHWCGVAIDPGTNRPYLQGTTDPYPGFYVSTSALTDPKWKKGDTRRYVDAFSIPFLVLYGIIHQLGVKQGDYVAVVINQNPVPKVVYAIVADAKRWGHGEGSYALHAAICGQDPKGGINNKDMMFIFFPGTALNENHWNSSWTKADVDQRGAACFLEWGGLGLAKEVLSLI